MAAWKLWFDIGKVSGAQMSIRCLWIAENNLNLVW